MAIELTNRQKQELGQAIKKVGYAPTDFVLSYEEDDSRQWLVLTNRDTSDSYSIARYGSSEYMMTYSVPGTSQKRKRSGASWTGVCNYLTNWAGEVKTESEAVDPWLEEAERTFDDDSLFTAPELPRVDKAIDAALEDLRSRAIEHGTSEKQIASELHEIKLILKKSARNSTRKEWFSIFKGIILEKIIDWGLEKGVFQAIIGTLIASAENVAQLAEQATRYLQVGG